MRIGILTGGGDVPGLNPCIKAVVNRVVEDGHDVMGIRRGWAGLLECRPDDPESVAACTVPLDPARVRTIDRTGGTALHTSRTNPARVKLDAVPDFLRDRTSAAQGTPGGAGAEPLRSPGGAGERPPRPPGGAGAKSPRSPEGSPRSYDFTPHILDVLSALKIDALIPIGGDDTLSYALRMHNEGVPVVAVPKTMDNDVHGTDYCIGFSTAVTRSVGFIHNLRTSAGSHERLAVVELFGRYSGETSLISAYLAGVDRAIISEVPFSADRLAELLLADKRANPSGYAVVTISEGATLEGGELQLSGEADAYGHRKLGGIGALTSELLRRRTGEGIISQQVGYLMRSGSPDSLDLMVATNYAVMAADLAVEGSKGRMVALRNGSYTNVPISATGEGARRVDVDALYDVDAYRPKVRHVGGKPMFLY